jgi:hypothetical protein
MYMSVYEAFYHREYKYTQSFALVNHASAVLGSCYGAGTHLCVCLSQKSEFLEHEFIQYVYSAALSSVRARCCVNTPEHV